MPRFTVYRSSDSNSAPAPPSASSLLLFSNRPSSPASPLLQGSPLKPHPYQRTVHGDLHHVEYQAFGPASNRSSASTGSEAGLAVGPYDKQEFDLDQFLEDAAGDSSSSNNGSELRADDFNFNFLDIGLAPQPNHVTPPPAHYPSLSPPSLPSSSNQSLHSLPSSNSQPSQPLPSPLTSQFPHPTRPSDWNSGAWDSLNPFANEIAPRPGQEGPQPAGFTLVKSAEESRTPQACQACRSRKSKCDGKANCSRCEGRGVACVYSTRAPRVRTKRPPNIRTTSSPSITPSSLSNCYSPDMQPQGPSTAPIAIFRTSRGEDMMQQSPFEINFAGGERRQGPVTMESESWTSSTVGMKSSRRGSRSLEAAPDFGAMYKAAAEQSRTRRRPSVDSNFPPPPVSHHPAPIPFTPHTNTHVYPHSASAYQTTFDSDVQTFRPPPLLQMGHRHSVAAPPHSLPPQHFAPTPQQHYDHTNSYHPTQTLHSYDDYHYPPPSLAADPYQPQFGRAPFPSSSGRGPSSSSSTKPSSSSQLGLYPRPSPLFEEADERHWSGGNDALVTTMIPAAAEAHQQPSSSEGRWEELSYKC